MTYANCKKKLLKLHLQKKKILKAIFIKLIGNFQITQKFAEFLPTFFSYAAGKSSQEFGKFLGYLKLPHQPYKKWSLKILFEIGH